MFFKTQLVYKVLKFTAKNGIQLVGTLGQRQIFFDTKN